MAENFRELKCPKCGVQVSLEKTICDHCGAYYVIENNRTYALESRPATDENLKKWFETMDLERKRRIKEGIHQPNDEAIKTIKGCVLMARNHLEKELKRIPKIAEVDETEVVPARCNHPRKVTSGWKRCQC